MSARPAGPIGERDQLNALAVFLPIFMAPEFAFGRWEQPPAEADGTMYFPYFVLSPGAAEFVGAVGEAGWILTGFDWSTWGSTPEGSALRAGGDALLEATPLQLARLLTLLIRQDRFVEGSLAAAYESGLLTGIIARCAALLGVRGVM